MSETKSSHEMEVPSFERSRQERIQELSGRVAGLWKNMKEKVSTDNFRPASVNQFIRETGAEGQWIFQQLLTAEAELMQAIYNKSNGLLPSPQDVAKTDIYVARAIYGENLRGNGANYNAASVALLDRQTKIRDYWNIVSISTEDFDAFEQDRSSSPKADSGTTRRQTELAENAKSLVDFLQYAQNYQG